MVSEMSRGAHGGRFLVWTFEILSAKLGGKQKNQGRCGESGVSGLGA